MLISPSSRLAEILRHQAALLEHIVEDQRYYSDYFRVAFYGNFPVGIRGRHYVVSVIELDVCCRDVDVFLVPRV